jgi:hypothetical protein
MSIKEDLEGVYKDPSSPSVTNKVAVKPADHSEGGGNKFSRYLASIDSFGYPVSLKYQRHQEFKSSIGGAVTVFVFMILGGFLAILLYRCISNETVKVYSYLEKVNRVRDIHRNLTLTPENFDVGVYFGYIGTNRSVADNLDLYFDYSLSTIDYQIISTPEEQEREGSTYYWRPRRQEL